MKIVTGMTTGLLLFLAAPLLAQTEPAAEPSPTAPVLEPVMAAPSPVEPATEPTPAEKAKPKPVASAPAPPPLTPEQTVDSLSDNDAKQAIELIRSNFLDAASVSEASLNRATLQGLIQRIGPGVAIEQKQRHEEAPSPFRSEILDDRIGYIRIGSLSPDHLQEFDAALGNLGERNITSLILDLRATPSSSDFELAAEFLKRLTPKGNMLFAIRRPSSKQERMVTSSQEPTFSGIIVTLVNKETAGAGELIAGVLRTLNNSMVVGQQTAGEAAEFAELPLRSGKTIRIAVAEVKLPQDELSIFPGGLKPDLETHVTPRVEAEVLKIGLEKGVGDLVWEKERPKLNEAALVARTNPEIDAEVSRSSRISRKAPYDATLQRAVDLITAIGIFTQKPAK